MGASSTAIRNPRTVTFPELQHFGRTYRTNSKLALAATSADDVKEADTNGWDTVYAIDMIHVNKAIEKKKSWPASFKQELAGGGTSIEGTFGCWQVDNEGDGHILSLTIPVLTCTAIYEGQSYKLDGSVVTAKVNLEFVTQGPVQDGAVHKELKVQGKSAGKPKPVSVSLEYAEGTAPDDDNAGYVFPGLFNAWFNANILAFDHVFSAISVNEAAAMGSFAWMLPHDHAYANIKRGNSGVFAVLAMTGDRNRGSLPYSVSSFAIPDGQMSGLLISSERFLMDLISPSMPAAFPGAKPEDFELQGDTVLTNKNAITVPIECDGTSYTGTVEARGFTATVRANELVLEVPKLTINISPGIDVVVDLHEYLEVTTKDRSDGTKVLWFNQIDAKVTHQVNYADWVQGLELGAEIVAGIILSVFGFNAAATKFVSLGLSKIAARILAAIVAAVIGGIVAAVANIPKFIGLAEDKKFDELPALNSLLMKGLDRIQWPESSGFAIRSVDLRKSLRIGLEPLFLK